MSNFPPLPHEKDEIKVLIDEVVERYFGQQSHLVNLCFERLIAHLNTPLGSEEWSLLRTRRSVERYLRGRLRSERVFIEDLRSKLARFAMSRIKAAGSLHDHAVQYALDKITSPSCAKYLDPQITQLGSLNTKLHNLIIDGIRDYNSKFVNPKLKELGTDDQSDEDVDEELSRLAVKDKDDSAAYLDRQSPEEQLIHSESTRLAMIRAKKTKLLLSEVLHDLEQSAHLDYFIIYNWEELAEVVPAEQLRALLTFPEADLDQIIQQVRDVTSGVQRLRIVHEYLDDSTLKLDSLRTASDRMKKKLRAKLQQRGLSVAWLETGEGHDT